MREIFFYESDFGNKLVEEFLDNLDPESASESWSHIRIVARAADSSFEILEETSGTNLWELRAEYAGSIYRVLAATPKGNRVILLHGFQKKSQKTPRQDMEIAQQRQKRYLQRQGYL
jgi:phage-related protein